MHSALAAMATTLTARRVVAAPAAADSLIVLWMNGGPSHVDTWDPKPGSKGAGPMKAIKTRRAGLELSEHMPALAEVADRLCVVRSLSSKEGNHQRAQYLGRTGYSPSPTLVHPALGSWVAKKLGAPASGLPAFVSLGGPAAGAGFLGAEYGPFVSANVGARPETAEAAVPTDRLDRRLALLDGLEATFAARVGSRLIEDRRHLYGAARRLMMSPSLDAFDVTKESAAVRSRYGDTDFGRGCLVARRLVQSGVRFVEVMLDGWDTHEDNFTRGKRQLAVLDPAMSSLVADLASAPQTGATNRTLILWMGEFGRTPRLNAREGRDHHPKAWSAVLAGPGVAPGIVGATDADGANVVGKVHAVSDLLATLATLLGLSPSEELVSPIGRPIAMTDGGAPIAAALP